MKENRALVAPVTGRPPAQGKVFVRSLTTIQKLWAKVFSNKRRGLRKPVRWLQLYRWIVRGQHRIVHALLLSWVHVLVVGLLVYAALTVHAPADSGMPWIFPLAKWVAALYQCMLLLDRGQRISRSWKQHRAAEQIE